MSGEEAGRLARESGRAVWQNRPVRVRSYDPSRGVEIYGGRDANAFTAWVQPEELRPYPRPPEDRTRRLQRMSPEDRLLKWAHRGGLDHDDWEDCMAVEYTWDLHSQRAHIARFAATVHDADTRHLLTAANRAATRGEYPAAAYLRRLARLVPTTRHELAERHAVAAHHATDDEETP